MKNKIVILMMAFIAMFGTTSCVERIDAGHEGIKFNLTGSNKGVDEVALVSGWQFYNPFMTGIYEYPSYVQTVNYPAFKTYAKGGLEFVVDPFVSIKMITGKAPEIFCTFRVPIDSIINVTLYTDVVNAFNNEFNKFEPDYIINNRDSIEIAIEQRLSKDFLRDGFELRQFTSGLQLPKEINNSIIAKMEAIQKAQTAENEVKVAEANAKKIIVQAEAEAEANKLKTQALTSAILEKMWIEKWDGSVPQVMGSNGSIFYDLNGKK